MATPVMMVIGMAAMLLDEPSPVARPNGIRILSATCFVLAVYLLVSGGLVAVGAMSLASGRYLLGDYATMGPVLYFGVAVVLAVLGIGLYKGWRIMRRLAIIVAALLMATSLLPVSAAVTYFQIGPLIFHGAKIILAVMAIRYLLQTEVVEWFSAGVPRST